MSTSLYFLLIDTYALLLQNLTGQKRSIFHITLPNDNVIELPIVVRVMKQQQKLSKQDQPSYKYIVYIYKKLISLISLITFYNKTVCSLQYIQKTIITSCTYMIQGQAERMRQITTFVVLFQVIWDITSQVFTMHASCLQ